jgi:hyperosmotically inducible protein
MNKQSDRLSFGSARGPILLALLCFGVGLMGCEQQGPAEEAGEQIDQAAENAGDRMEETKEAVSE